MHEIQKVYESQGIGIHDKHFGAMFAKWVIRLPLIAKMTHKFIVGEVVSKYQFDRKNKKFLLKEDS